MLIHLSFCFLIFFFKPINQLVLKVIEGERLSLSAVQRSDMGGYLCIASNGIPPSVSKRYDIQVNCKWPIIRDGSDANPSLTFPLQILNLGKLTKCFSMSIINNVKASERQINELLNPLIDEA